MKKVLLLHGYNGIPPMFYWIKQKLEKLEYTVIMLDLPTQEGVRYCIWKQEFEKIKENFREEIIVIAHSIRKSISNKIFKGKKFECKIIYWTCWI